MYLAVRKAKQQIIVAFRGTANTENWLDNLKLFKAPFPYASRSQSDIQVHAGFLETYRPLRARYFAALNSLKALFPSYTIIFTGHSLGGALAQIGAADALSNLKLNVKMVKVMAFSAPRAGNEDFANYLYSLGVHIDRFVEENDIVPHLPPHSAGYTHVPGEKYYREGETYSCLGGEDEECSNSRVPFLSIIKHGSFFGESWFWGKDQC
jgi:predicted lipase